MKKLLRIITVLSMCLLLNACSVLNTEYYAEEIPTSNSQSTQAGVLTDALQARIDEEIIDAEDLPLQYQYINGLLRSIAFEILSVDEEQHIMIIRCCFVDVMSMADSFGDAQISITEYYQQCIEQMQNGLAPTMETCLTIAYEESFEQGEIVIAISQSEGLAELLSCGVYSATKDLLAAE